MNRVVEVVFASGTKGNSVMADGNGGVRPRGWYVRWTGGGTLGPFRTKTEANYRAYGQERPFRRQAEEGK